MTALRKAAQFLATGASCENLPSILNEILRCKMHKQDKQRYQKSDRLFGGLLICHIAKIDQSQLELGYQRDLVRGESWDLFSISAEGEIPARLPPSRLAPQIRDQLMEVATVTTDRPPKREIPFLKGFYELPDDLFGLPDPVACGWILPKK